MDQSFLEEFEHYLEGQGLASSTIGYHKTWVLRFLNHLEFTESGLSSMTIEHVDSFLALWLPSLARRTKHIPVAAMRHMLRFLFSRHVLDTDLSVQVIGPRTYRGEFLPKGLQRSEIARIVGQVDPDQPEGRRDYAIIMLFATYGLRVSEILELKVRDIDWQRDRISVYRPKTKDHLELPLLPEVGNAIVRYLEDRQSLRTDSPLLFPFSLKCGSAKVGSIVKAYGRKAGVDVAGRATKVFRHSLAMEMVSSGSPFKAISDALGHRHCSSTYVYAKTDIKRLRQAALCPPGGDACLSC